MELDSIVAAMTGQSAQTQATCASLMVAHGFFFAAMKAVFVFPEVLRAVLEDIKLQVNQGSSISQEEGDILAVFPESVKVSSFQQKHHVVIKLQILGLQH